MKKRSVILLTLLLLITAYSYSQCVKGKVIDSESKESLSFVNMGIVNTSIGTITDAKGEFELYISQVPADAELKITMIGYESKTISISELASDFCLIELKKTFVELKEIKVGFNGRIKNVGNIRANNSAGVCGWGGTKFGKGHELGLELDLGDNLVRLEELNLKMHKQSFATCVFRLHIREIENGLPVTELLHENIYFELTSPKGWQNIELSDYNIVANGKVALTIEWIKVSNIIEDKLVKMNGSKKARPVVLFKSCNKDGRFFIRKGSEAPWKCQENSSPSFYISVRE